MGFLAAGIGLLFMDAVKQGTKEIQYTDATNANTEYNLFMASS